MSDDANAPAAARIFISYRSRDGADKATALARELGQAFGDDQVFLDKDDLLGGDRWRQAITQALAARPVMLLLVTPGLLQDAGPDGRRRIELDDDPVRRELQAALDAGARVLPLLADGVEALPPAADLPAPFDRLAEHSWRRLRAYDWPADVARVIADLRGHGVTPRQPPTAPSRSGSRRVVLATAATVALVAGTLAWMWRSGAERGLGGTWAGTLGADAVRLVLQQQGDRLVLQSHPLDITARTDWAEYRAFWLERFGSPLEAVRYQGEGTVRLAPGSPPSIDVGFKLVSEPGGAEIDGGNLSAVLAADGRTLKGTRWLNSRQAAEPAELRRTD